MSLVFANVMLSSFSLKNKEEGRFCSNLTMLILISNQHCSINVWSCMTRQGVSDNTLYLITGKVLQVLQSLKINKYDLIDMIKF